MEIIRKYFIKETKFACTNYKYSLSRAPVKIDFSFLLEMIQENKIFKYHYFQSIS